MSDREFQEIQKFNISEGNRVGVRRKDEESERENAPEVGASKVADVVVSSEEDRLIEDLELKFKELEEKSVKTLRDKDFKTKEVKRQMRIHFENQVKEITTMKETLKQREEEEVERKGEFEKLVII